MLSIVAFPCGVRVCTFGPIVIRGIDIWRTVVAPELVTTVKLFMTLNQLGKDADPSWKKQVSYSQHFIFSVTYEWAQWARAFVPGKPFRLVKCNPLAYWAHSYVTQRMKCCEYWPPDLQGDLQIRRLRARILQGPDFPWPARMRHVSLPRFFPSFLKTF